MHKSKLSGFIIDCQTNDLQNAAKFWGAALGMDVRQLPEEEGETYAQLVDPAKQMHIEVQLVDHPSRVHLDIETDDVEAEVRRLEGHGARRIQHVNTWVIMEGRGSTLTIGSFRRGAIFCSSR